LRFTGISGSQRALVRVSDVEDGLSNTYVVGDQFRYTECYSDYRLCAEAGVKPENSPFGPGNEDDYHIAFGEFGIEADVPVEQATLQGTLELGHFGSAHGSICQFAFGDGSVRVISNSLDPQVHNRLCNRQDGQPIPGDAW
jgi:hypothetical protein